jgi:hypothetical protein
MNRKWFCAMFVASLICMGGMQAAQAEVWNAVTQFNATGTQSSADVWQYLSMDGMGGTNGSYAPMGYTEAPAGPPYPYFAWIRDAGWGASLLAVPTQSSYIRADFGGLNTSVLTWQSPIDGFVDIYVDAFKEAPYTDGDGAGYWLFRDNDPTLLASGSFAGDQTTPGINATTLHNVPVSVGTKLYFQSGPNTASFASDTLSVDFVVTSVPEPGTFILLGGALMGLLAFVWRKRK